MKLELNTSLTTTNLSPSASHVLTALHMQRYCVVIHLFSIESRRESEGVESIQKHSRLVKVSYFIVKFVMIFYLTNSTNNTKKFALHFGMATKDSLF